MSNGERSMFSLTATSLETVIPMEEQGGRVRQASASLDHKSKCPGHSTCWLHSCLLHFSSTFFKKETCRPEGENKAAWKLKKKKSIQAFTHTVSSAWTLFPTKPLCSGSAWASGLVQKSLVPENNFPDPLKLGMCLPPLWQFHTELKWPVCLFINL